MVLRRLLWLCLLCPALAWGQRANTRDALDRLDEILEMRREDGQLDPREITPIILVSARPRYEASSGWFQVQALGLLTRAFGAGSVRACEGCMQPRAWVDEGRLEQRSGAPGMDEIMRFDDRYRGTSARARSAAWIDESRSGVSARIVDLRSGRVIFAQNVDPDLREYRGTRRSFRRAEELERRARGDTLTHIFVDMGIYPGQHASMEWTDQWGETNNHLSGVVLSFYDPVLGIGMTYHRALEWQNILIGGQLVLSIPTVVAEAQSQSGSPELIDPLLTGVAMLRYPFGGSNYAGLLSISTNGEVAFGITLLNTSLIPLLP